MLNRIELEIEIIITKLMIWFLKRGYGPKCETTDLQNWPELKHDTPGRCPTCRANEVIDWLEEHLTIFDPRK